MFVTSDTCAQPPCSRGMVKHLERNEKMVSWLQPVDGLVEEQLPAIRFKGVFYTLSLRMMKSIWRHVRSVFLFIFGC